jgi:hypothetical protein
MGPVTGVRKERRSVVGRAPEPSPADQVRRWVDQTCAEQGLPKKVIDQAALRDIAVLMGGGAEMVSDSDLPVRSYSAWVESVPAPDSGSDHDRVEESRDNRSLSGSGQGVPLAS